MSEEKKTCCCQNPDMLKSTPEKCSPETIRECHGDQPAHPCVSQDKQEGADKE
ncbi:MAG: hypothetical protein C1942_04460 [Prosthecochloris sp.]|uniref:hypothetical protein n=1 Tax=Prosthecochloris sp. TaxID=290513 RepID=UPI0013C9D022|nr:hypothetical protein [Prosthecochloris sp.]NEX11939.1 hypothetical protein [Prosthecochloris sp.]